jgi:hypothetical protein
MGVFDLFKKKEESNQNPLITKMLDWIEHPMEFNKKPDSIEIFDERDLSWPTKQPERCALVKFRVDDDEYIGFTGPITWCFIGIDFSKMSIDSLYETYCGWHIEFATINSKDYDDSQVGKTEIEVINKLIIDNYTNIQTLQNTLIGGNNYYEFEAEKNGKKTKVVGTEKELIEYPIEHILPFYEYIGITWNPLDKE